MTRRALRAAFAAIHAAAASGPMRAILGSVYSVLTAGTAMRAGLPLLALAEFAAGGLLAGVAVGASRRRGFATAVWEPAERTPIILFALVVLLHGVLLRRVASLALGSVLLLTRLHRARAAAEARRRVGVHPPSAIADVAVQEAIDRRFEDADPFGAAWRDLRSESSDLRGARDVVASALADDIDAAADRLILARAQGAEILPPRTFHR